MNEPSEYLAALDKGWQDELFASSWSPPQPGQKVDYVYASQRRSCVRAMALDLIHPEDRDRPDAESMERMRKGLERERALNARLLQIGPRVTPQFDVVESQRRFEIKDRDGTVIIVGKVDGRLSWGKERPWFEVKSGQSFANCRTIEDLDAGRWTSHSVDQLLAYLLADGQPWGFFIIDRPGLPTFIPVVLTDHLERAERFLRDARTAVDARFGLGPLPPITDDRSLCLRCDHHGKTCTPPGIYGEGLQIISDEQMIRDAERREQLQGAAKEFTRLDASLKERLRGVQQALLGPFEVRGAYQRHTRYEIPPEVKQQYRVADPKGRFSVSISRVVEEPDEAVLPGLL